MKIATTLFLAVGLSTLAHAQVSQQQQEEAAQRAYTSSANEYNEVADEAAKAESVAEAVSDAAERTVEAIADVATSDAGATEPSSDDRNEPEDPML